MCHVHTFLGAYMKCCSIQTKIQSHLSLKAHNSTSAPRLASQSKISVPASSTVSLKLASCDNQFFCLHRAGLCVCVWRKPHTHKNQNRPNLPHSVFIWSPIVSLCLFLYIYTHIYQKMYVYLCVNANH